MAIFILNLTYLFTGTGKLLSEYEFFCQTLSGKVEGPGNRFENIVLAKLPVPLPESFVVGIDLQKRDFEQGMWSYLAGEHKFRGWWYWYLYAIVVKTPDGVLGLALMALVRFCWSARGGYWKLNPAVDGRARIHEVLLVVLPMLGVLVFVSSQTGFSRYLRYVLPAYPFAFILISQVFRESNRVVLLTGSALLIWAIGSSVSTYPFQMSYFNRASGGSISGHKHLLDANIDWGQDILMLNRWCQAHPEAQPLYTSLHSPIAKWGTPRPVSSIPMLNPDPGEVKKPPAGWYAISVHQLYGRGEYYRYLLDYEPVSRIGFSILIFHIPEDERAVGIGSSLKTLHPVSADF